jgi:membrane protein DedA with SNARE-associated domain
VLLFASLLLGTFVSEDLSCLAAGLAIQRGELGLGPAVAACMLGILAGDVALWGAGRLCGPAVLAWKRVARRLDREHTNALQACLQRHAAAAIVGSRFLPGTRLPLYVIAGLIKVPASVFISWALVGTLLWTPALVLASAGLLDAISTHLPLAADFGWIPTLLTAIAILSSLRAARIGRLAIPITRSRGFRS